MLEDLAIDYARRRVTVAGRAVPLTATEYEVVRVLSVRAGRVDDPRSRCCARPGAAARPVTGGWCAPW